MDCFQYWKKNFPIIPFRCTENLNILSLSNFPLRVKWKILNHYLSKAGNLYIVMPKEIFQVLPKSSTLSRWLLEIFSIFKIFESLLALGLALSSTSSTSCEIIAKTSQKTLFYRVCYMSNPAKNHFPNSTFQYLYTKRG